MIEPVLAVAIALLVAGVIGSFVPLLPSGLLSLAGLYVYVFFGAEPIHLLVLAALTIAGLLAAVLEQFGGPIAAKASGASTRVVVAAAIVGLVLFFVAGPLGTVAGVLAVVFLSELASGTELDVAGRRALYTGGGILASAVLQFVLTIGMLVGFLLAIVVL